MYTYILELSKILVGQLGLFPVRICLLLVCALLFTLLRVVPRSPGVWVLSTGRGTTRGERDQTGPVVPGSDTSGSVETSLWRAIYGGTGLRSRSYLGAGAGCGCVQKVEGVGRGRRGTL